MHELNIGEIKRQLASKWNELKPAQLLALLDANLLVRSTDSKFPKLQRHRIRKERLRILLQLPKRVFMRINPFQVLQLHNLISFLDKGYGGFTAQLFPKFSCGAFSTALYGPKERIRNMTFLEFIYADTFFTAFTRKKDPAMLDRLIACMYREQRWFHFIGKRLASYGGDCRQDFNQHLVEERIPKVKRLTDTQKLAVLLWYRGCRQELEKEFPLVFSSKNKETASRKGWDGVLLGMSGQAANIELTGRANIRNILGMMQQRFEEMEKAEKRRNENKGI